MAPAGGETRERGVSGWYASAPNSRVSTWQPGVWREVAILPRDRRFVIPLRCSPAAGEPVEAARILAKVDDRFDYHPDVAFGSTQLRMRWAELAISLERWQAADKDNPEPVRRRIRVL